MRDRCFVGLMLAVLVSGCKEEVKADDGAISLPSGRSVAFLDVVTNAPGPEGAVARFRFVAAGLKQDEDWSEDMQALCETYAAPRTEGMVPMPQQVVIALADRDVPFGEAAPDAVQFFEGYALDGNTCVWEMF